MDWTKLFPIESIAIFFAHTNTEMKRETHTTDRRRQTHRCKRARTHTHKHTHTRSQCSKTYKDVQRETDKEWQTSRQTDGLTD